VRFCHLDFGISNLVNGRGRGSYENNPLYPPYSEGEIWRKRYLRLVDHAIIMMIVSISSGDELHSRGSSCRQEHEGGGMIKGIIGCKVRKDTDLEPILLKLKSHAAQYQGFKGMENLVSEKNASVVAMVTTWESLEEWKSWAQSTITQKLFRQAEALLVEEPRVTTYRMMMPAAMWV